MQHSGLLVVAVTGDDPARNKCERLGIRLHETLGLIELEKKWGVITKGQALKILDKAPSTSLHEAADVLANVGEKVRRQQVPENVEAL